VSVAPEPPAIETRPALTLFELPAAEAEARSKYLAQGFLLFVGLVFLVGTFIVLRWANYAVEQQSVLWETRLRQAAFTDASHVAAQIDSRLAPWERFARADSFRLTVMQAFDARFEDRQSAQRYVENALTLAAQRDGLLRAQSGPNQPLEVNAETALKPGPGIALVDLDGVSQTRIGAGHIVQPKLRPMATSDTGARIYGPYVGTDNGDILLSVVLPIRAIQSQNLVAELHVTYQLDAGFLPLSAPAGVGAQETAFALIHPTSGDVLTLGQSAAGPRLMLDGAPNFAASPLYRWASATGANGAAVIRLDEGSHTLAAAYSAPDFQWVAVRSVLEKSALAPVKRQMWIWLLLCFIALSVSCGLILFAWRRGIEHRAAAISASRQAANQALSQANTFLNKVSEAQPSALFVQDSDGRIIFANSAACHMLGQGDSAGLVGQNFSALFSADDANALQRAAETARATGHVITASLTLASQGGQRSGRITAALLDDQDEPARVILTFDDLTDIITLRAKRESALRQLVTVLTGLIDARDPHSAAHSRSVAGLARRVGLALNYTGDLLRDLEMAALLSNAGKILVPRSLLTKPDALSNDELETVRHALHKTSSLLEEVDFDGRVAKILEARQDPTDADALDVQAATIIQLANALIGMISPRAHRSALSLEAAFDQLKQDDAAGTDQYRNVLAALEHVTYNHASLAQRQ